MVLDYLDQQVGYASLLSLLQIRPMGTSRRNVTRLVRLGFEVIYHEANLPILASHLGSGDPVIVFVDTEQLSYWSRSTGHALVVIGLTSDMVTAHDPALPFGPRNIPIGEFELAWIEGDYMCAVLKIPN